MIAEIDKENSLRGYIMNSETTKETPKLYQVLKTDRCGDEPDGFCCTNCNSGFVMDFNQANDVQQKLTERFGDVYKYEVIPYVERF